MKKIGFNIQPENAEPATVKVYSPQPEEPKLSVVTVRIENGAEYPYLNDKFNLNIGDKVFVDGKLKGRLGTVVAVTTKFKVSLTYYKYVLAKADFNIHGAFRPIANFFVSRGEDAIPPEQLETWLPPVAPDEEEEEFVCGDGYTVNLDDMESAEDFDSNAVERAVELLEEGAVKFISVVNGSGYAFIETSRRHIVEFCLDGRRMVDIYCDCLAPRLCKHIFAVAIAIKRVMDLLDIGEGEAFTAIESELFSNATDNNQPTVIL